MNYVMLFISSMFFQMAVIFMFEKLSHLKMKISNKLIVILPIISGLQAFFTCYEKYHWIGPLFTIVYLWVAFPKLYRCDKKVSQNYSIIIWAVSILLDIIMMLIMNLLKIVELNYEKTLIYKSICTMIVSCIMLGLSITPLFLKLSGKFHEKVKKLNISSKFIEALFVFYFIIGLLSSLNIKNKEIIMIILACCFAMSTIVLYLIFMKYQIVSLKITNDFLEQNTETHLKVINDYRILKHNLENNLLGLKTVANKKTKILLDELIKEYNSSFYVKYDINSLPTGINGFILEKIARYEARDLKISINNKLTNNILKSIGSRSYNLFCEAMGIALDNALSAASNSKEKIIYLEFKESENNLNIKLMNTFSGNLDLEKLGTLEYTSKKLGHGLGLYSLYGRKKLKINTRITNNIFINDIEIKKLS